MKTASHCPSAEARNTRGGNQTPSRGFAVRTAALCVPPRGPGDASATIPGLGPAIDGQRPEKGHETLYVVGELNAPRMWFAVPLLSSTAAEIEALLVRARDIAATLRKPVRAWVSDKQDLAELVTGVQTYTGGDAYEIPARAIKQKRTQQSC